MTFRVGDAVKGPPSCEVAIIIDIQEDVTTFVTLQELLLSGELGDVFENIPMLCLEKVILKGVWKAAYAVHKQNQLNNERSTSAQFLIGEKRDRALALIADKYKMDVDILSSLILDLDAVNIISLN